LERSDIIIFWHETCWKPNVHTLQNCYHGSEIANIGIQFRFEVGHFIDKVDKIRIFYLPKYADGIAGVIWWISNKKDDNLHGFQDSNTVLNTTIQYLQIY
jgi:hypothetical protein